MSRASKNEPSIESSRPFAYSRSIVEANLALQLRDYHYEKRMICWLVSTVAGTPKGMMHRGVAWPILILVTIGSDGLSMTSTKSCLYSSTYISSIGLPMSMPDTTSKIPVCFSVLSILRYFLGVGCSSLVSRRRTLFFQSSSVGKSPYF